MAEQKRKFWGWGYEGQGPSSEHQESIAKVLAARFGGAPLEITPPPRLEELSLRQPRLSPPSALRSICSQSAQWWSIAPPPCFGSSNGMGLWHA